MSAIEKLFVQIFERKNWIIDQAEQQTRLFDQHLVSKLLIDGIVPPPWLRNPLLQSLDSDPEELNKDDIVFAALFPQSQSTVPYSGRHCSLYSKLFVTTDDGWYPSGLHSEVQALKKNCDAGDGLSKLPECSVNNDGCSSTGAPQMDCGAISPQSQMEGRPSDSYHDPALSLAKLQRSKSRQRALELRNSAKTAKRCSRNDNGTVTSSLQLDHLEVSDLVNAFDTNSQSCAIEEVKKGDCETQNVDKSNYSGRVTRSKSLAQKLNSLNVVSSSIAKEHGPQSNHVHEPLETVNPTCFTNGSCGVKESNKGAYQTNNQTNNAYHKRFTRSRSSSQTNIDNELLRLETSCILMPDGSLKSIAKSTQLSQPLTSQHSQALAVPVVGSFQSQKDQHVCAVEAREHLTRSSSVDGYIARYSQPQSPVEGISKSLSSNFCNQNATFSRSASSNKSQNVQDTEIAAERSLSCQKDSRLDTEVAIDSAEEENIAAQTAGGNRRAVITCTTEGSLRPVSSFTSDDRDSRYRCSASKNSSLVKSLYIETVMAEKAPDTQENRLSAAKVSDNLEHRSDATVSKVDVGFDGLVENNSVYLEPTLADVSPKIAMDASVLRPSSNFVMSVKPKQLDFDDVEESSMNGVSSPEKRPVTLLEPGNLLDDVSSIECQEKCNSSQEPHLLERQEVLIREEGPQNEYCKSHLKEADEAWGTLNAMSSDQELPVVQKKLCTHTSIEGQKIPYRETSSSTNHLIPSQVACENSPGSLPKEVMVSKFVSENITLENDDCSTKILADAFSAAVGSPSAALMDELKVGLTHQVLCLGTLSKSGELSRGKLANDGKDTGFPTEVQIVESSEESIISDVDRSRPQHKKRKTESQSDKFLPASSSFSEKPLESINRSSVSTNLNTKDDNQEVAIEVRNLTSHQEEDIEHLNVRTSPTEVRVEEKFILDGRDRSHDTLFTFTSNELGGFPVSCLTEQASSSSHNCLMEQIGVANPFHFGVDSTRRCTIDENLLTLHHQNRSGHASSELLDCVERSTSRVGNDTRGDAKLLDGSSVSPGIYHSDLIGRDETVPEFEKFVIQPDDAQPSTAVDGIELEKLSLLSNTIEYPSILENFRKYAFMHSPSCYSSTPYGLQKIPDLFQSLPNGLLEGLDLRTSLSPNDERGRSLSDCLPNFKGQHSWDIKKPYASPVTLWDKITSNFGSSAKRESLKPELPCISEENENVDEISDTFQMAIGSKLITSSIRREPLAEITDNAKASAAVSQDDILADGRGLDSISTELSFSWTHNKAKKKHEKQNGCKKRCTGTGKETQSIFLGPNGAKRTTESIYNRSGRPKLSGKKSMKKGPTYSGGKSTCNNIVSSITSFIPLVQQKQAAAALTGKRDVKVKALEAAVAAKRIAEKKENERKMKKEAVRLEKERLEQKNLRQVELQKKKKVEERKKKEAEMAAKKRQREEEERKERERKRKRIDDAKRKRQEHEEKTCAKKEEKEMKSRAAGERAQESKEFIDEREIQNNLDNNMEGIIKNMPEAETLTVSNPTNDETKASFVEYSEAVNDCDNDGKVIGNMIKATEDDDLIVKNTLQEQSYEISPYKGSDDEDEDEDDRPNNKFIPSWASKHRLSLIVSSQKIVDPETVFPPQSFCSIAEVLLPRRLQLK